VFLLSPAKLLVVLVVALVVLGPDKLPKVARQIGSLWNDFRRFREKLESEVRGTFPDLPSTETITQAVRSPLTFLDSLATEPTGTVEETGTEDRGAGTVISGTSTAGTSAGDSPAGATTAGRSTPPTETSGDDPVRSDLAHTVGAERSGTR
jgi:sec-independent protein translocase protein TatB